MISLKNVSAHSTNRKSITEIFLSYENSLDLVLPMLSHLSRESDHRWLTWVGPQLVDSSWLRQSTFNVSSTRLIHSYSDDETLWVFWEALKLGNSHTVVANLNHLSESSRANLEEAAHFGDTKGLVLINR